MSKSSANLYSGIFPSICRYCIVDVVVVVVDVVDPVVVPVVGEVVAVVGVEDVIGVEDVVGVGRSLLSSFSTASLYAISLSLSAMLPVILATLSLTSASSGAGGVVSLALRSNLS